MRGFGFVALAGALALAGCGDGATGTGSAAAPGGGGDASGTMPCSAGESSFDKLCDWRVTRREGGAADIFITKPAGAESPGTRVISYAGGSFSTTGGVPMDVGKYGDIWVLGVQNREFYRFPDSVITGG